MGITKEQARQVKVGDSVGFKFDIEQGSKVYAIREDRYRGIEFQVKATGHELVDALIWVNAEDCF
jgi:hypothetical protein